MNRLIEEDDIFIGTANVGKLLSNCPSGYCRVLKINEDGTMNIFKFKNNKVMRNYSANLFYSGWQYVCKYSKLAELILLP